MERFLETLLGNISETVEVIRFYIYATFLQRILTKKNVSETFLKHCLVCRGGMGSVQSEPVHPSLNTPIVLQPYGVPTRRVLDLDTSGSIDEIMSRLSAEGLRTNDQAEQWSKLMK